MAAFRLRKNNILVFRKYSTPRFKVENFIRHSKLSGEVGIERQWMIETTSKLS